MFLETCFTTLNYGTNTQTHPRFEIFLYEVLKNLWVQLDPFFRGSKGYHVQITSRWFSLSTVVHLWHPLPTLCKSLRQPVSTLPSEVKFAKDRYE